MLIKVLAAIRKIDHEYMKFSKEENEIIDGIKRAYAFVSGTEIEKHFNPTQISLLEGAIAHAMLFSCEEEPKDMKEQLEPPRIISIACHGREDSEGFTQTELWGIDQYGNLYYHLEDYQTKKYRWSLYKTEPIGAERESQAL